jgi:hypothetical protein
MIDASKDGIWTRTKFLDTPLADTAFNLTIEKLGGWSIGFAPLKHHTIEQGRDMKCADCLAIWETLAESKGAGDHVPGAWGAHFKQWELLEYSSVPIPMNQEAINHAVQRGLIVESLVDRFFQPTDIITTEDQPAVVAASNGSNADSDIPEAIMPAVSLADRQIAERVINRITRKLDHAAAARRTNEILRSKEL